MEKLKWLILFSLLMILGVVIFRKSEVSKEEVSTNYANVNVKIQNLSKDKAKTNLYIEEGNYIFPLESFQIIEGFGQGWNIKFSMPFKDKQIIMVFDIVDTTNINFYEGKFPITISTASNNFLNIKKSMLYRGSFMIGFWERVSSSYSKEEIVPMTKFICRIDTAWKNDTIGGLKMDFIASHSSLLEDIYGLRYSINGNIFIDNNTYTRRIIQK